MNYFGITTAPPAGRKKAEAYEIYVAFTFLCCSPIYAIPALIMSIRALLTSKSNYIKAKKYVEWEIVRIFLCKSCFTR